MKVDLEMIKGIAHLARLEFKPEEAESFVQDFSKILNWIEKLEEVPTEGVAPLIHMSEEVNVWREDEALNRLTHEEALYNAPKKDSDYFRVPKFLG